MFPKPQYNYRIERKKLQGFFFFFLNVLESRLHHHRFTFSRLSGIVVFGGLCAKPSLPLLFLLLQALKFLSPFVAPKATMSSQIYLLDLFTD